MCEGTKLSLTSSQSGRQLLLSLNSGNLELNYPLGTEADTLLTPDLRLLMPGPGTVHVAVRVAPNGDTCVQSLPWNSAAVVISESMGDDTYQVKPDEAVMFKGRPSEAGQRVQGQLRMREGDSDAGSQSCAACVCSCEQANYRRRAGCGDDAAGNASTDRRAIGFRAAARRSSICRWMRH